MRNIHKFYVIWKSRFYILTWPHVWRTNKKLPIIFGTKLQIIKVGLITLVSVTCRRCGRGKVWGKPVASVRKRSRDYESVKNAVSSTEFMPTPHWSGTPVFCLPDHSVCHHLTCPWPCLLPLTWPSFYFSSYAEQVMCSTASADSPGTSLSASSLVHSLIQQITMKHLLFQAYCWGERERHSPCFQRDS